MKKIFTLCVVMLLFTGLLLSAGCSKRSSQAKAPANPIVENAVRHYAARPNVTRFEVHGESIFISFKNDELPGKHKAYLNEIAMIGALELDKNKVKKDCLIYVLPESAAVGDFDNLLYTNEQ